MQIRLFPALVLALSIILAGMLLSYSRSRPAATDPVVINGVAVPPVPTLVPEQVSLGQTLYVRSCSACHGVNLQGQPNWRVPLPTGAYPAPPHDNSGHTWHHSDGLLEEIVRDGGTGKQSAMPAFREQFTEEEMKAILTYIKSVWSRDEREFQWWVTFTQGGR